jgi:hypothetical protein
VSRTDGPVFRVEWSPDRESARWDGGELSMTDLRGIGHKAVALADRLIANMLGATRHDLDIGTLRDKISEYKNGYSFVHD